MGRRGRGDRAGRRRGSRGGSGGTMVPGNGGVTAEGQGPRLCTPNATGDAGSGTLTCGAQDQNLLSPQPGLPNTIFLPKSCCPQSGGTQMRAPHSLGSQAVPRLPYLCGARARLTAACRWRACGSCCWPSRPCARGWTRRSPAARPWLWCSAAPAPCRSCRRAWAAPGRGSARSAPTPPQAPVLQGKGDGEAGRAAVPASPPPSPGTHPAPQGHQSPVLSPMGHSRG